MSRQSSFESAALTIAVVASIAACVSPQPTPEPASAPAEATHVEVTSAPVAATVSVEEPSEADDQPIVPGILPKQLREIGAATLTLHFVSSGDGGPAYVTVWRLWRLRVPASHGWTAGDEIAMTYDTKSSPKRIWRDLPYGIYRLEHTDKRRGGADPPEFTIEKPENEITLTVDDRRTFPVRLAVYGADGGLYDTCSVRSHGWMPIGSVDDEGYPAWATPRVPQRPFKLRRPRPSSTIGDRATERARECRAEADGWFRIGDVTETRGGREEQASWTVSLSPAMSISVTLRYSEMRTAEFVAVAPREDEIRQRVLDEQSRTIADAKDAHLEMQCSAIPRSDEPRQWESIPVHVKVERDGYETLRFDWTVATRDVKYQMRKAAR